MTVPCSVDGCPRSAIGQGLGVWAGYSAAFGPPEGEDTMHSASDAASGEDSQQEGHSDRGAESAGVLPVDGFVVGAENQSLRLGVIPPQLRSKANLFAMSPFSIGGGNTDMLSLRVDVTLAKTVAVLQGFAKEPASKHLERRNSPPSPSSRLRRPLKNFAAARRVHHHGSMSPLSGSGGTRHNVHGRRPRRGPAGIMARGAGYADHLVDHDRRSPGPRPGATRIAPEFRALLGGSEAGRESGSVSGVRATDTDEDEDDEEFGYGRRYHPRNRTSRSCSAMSFEPTGDAVQDANIAHNDRDDYFAGIRDDDVANVGDDEDDDDSEDDFGGAFARPRQPLGYGEEAELRRRRRHRKRGDSLMPVDAAPGEDSGWDTEASSSFATPKQESLEKAALSSSTALAANSFAATASLAAKSGGSQEDTLPNAVEGKNLTPEHLPSDLTDSLECQLCYLLFYEPVTTPCGHTFCRTCFARSLDHSSKCPLCRTNMPSFAFFQDHPLNQTLLKLLNSQLGAPESDIGKTSSSTKDEAAATGEEQGEGAFPKEDLLSLSRLGVFADSHPTARSTPLSDRARDDSIPPFGLRHLYNERVSSVQAEERESSTWMPIFVCTLAFPGMPTNLHIFEPRYRLMVRRCLQGSGPPRFGMILPVREPGVQQYGTMLEIKSCQMLLDGRSMLETVGWRRFKLLETGSLDGYMTGRIEYVDDITSQQLAEEEDAVLRRNAELQQRQRGSNESQAAMPELLTPTIARDEQARVEGDANDPSVVLPPLGNQSNGDDPNADLHTRPEPTMADLVSSCVSFVEMLRTQTTPGLFEQILATYGPVPQPIEVAQLSWWLGMVLPVDEHAKSALLALASPRKRLERIAGWIEVIQENWGPRP